MILADEMDTKLIYGERAEEKILKILRSVELKSLTRDTISNMLKKVEHILKEEEDYELLAEIKNYIESTR